MTTDDFAITMACLDAIEQEVRRARSVLRQEVLPEPCGAEVWSTDYYPAGHIDPYWIRCTKVGPHDQHQDSNTGLSWPDQPETPAQDAHTPRGATNTLPGGTESGEVGGGAQESPVGDRLRALGIRLRDAASNPDPANDENIELSGYAYWVMSQGIEEFANQADRGRAAHQADVENLGRANVALVGQVDRVRRSLDSLAANYEVNADVNAREPHWADIAADLRRILTALGGASEPSCDPWNACPEHGDQHWRECLDRETALIAALDEARGQVDAVRSLAKQMRHEAASVQPMTERGIGLWDASAALDKIVGGPGQDVRHG